jgi:hypothetical protein
MEGGAASEHSACAALFSAGILARLKGSSSVVLEEP